MYFFRDDLKLAKPVKVDVPHNKFMMCLNESELDPMKVVLKDFYKLMDNIHLNRYHNSITQYLIRELSDYAQVPQDALIMGNGADEMLYYLFTALRDDKEHFALSIAPSYFDYKSYCNAVGLKIKFIDLEPDFNIDPVKISKAAQNKYCKLIILCNPNNPTGNLLKDSSISQIIKDNPDKLVLIDETYFEFAQVTYKHLISTCPNLIIIRSFSKAFSAAGLRFGYLIANPHLINELKKVVTAFNLSLFTQTMAYAILKNKHKFLSHNAEIIREKNKLFEQLSQIPNLTVFPSSTNFLLFKHKYYIDLFQYLIQNEYALRMVADDKLLKNCLRVTVCDKIINREFVDLLKGFINYEKV